MSYQLLIVCKASYSAFGSGGAGIALTSQVVSFADRADADAAASKFPSNHNGFAYQVTKMYSNSGRIE